MNVNKNIVRLIFGLKVSHLRSRLNISLERLSKDTGISKSYLNEIEKGKKHPQTDKIITLSKALGTTYEELVSLKLPGNLKPISDLLLSDKMQNMPLSSFGFNEQTILEMAADDPEKTHLMLSTLLTLSSIKGVDKQYFLSSSAIAYLQSHDNYLPNIEENAKICRKTFLSNHEKINFKNLDFFAENQFGIKTKVLSEDEITNFDIHSIYVKASKVLLLNPKLNEEYKIYCLVKEIGNQYLKNSSNRVYTHPYGEYDNFDQAKSDVESDYFANAFILPQEGYIADLDKLCEIDEFDFDLLKNIQLKYKATNFSMIKRLSNLWRIPLNFKKFMMISFTHEEGTNMFELDVLANFLELNRPDTADGVYHYCKKTSSRGIILEHIENPTIEFRQQISIVHVGALTLDTFALTTVERDPLNPKTIRSISMVPVLSPDVIEKLTFLSNSKRTEVGVICETCPLENCKFREAPPTLNKQNQQNIALGNKVEELIKQYSKKQ